MQTIKINTRTNTNGNVTMFTVNGVCVAHVGTDLYNVGRYAGQFSPFASCNNSTFADAVEFISDAIESHFAAFGLNVEFVNA